MSTGREISDLQKRIKALEDAINNRTSGLSATHTLVEDVSHEIATLRTEVLQIDNSLAHVMSR